jgi:hypothetical protein
MKSNVYSDIKAERKKQDAEWGGPNHDNGHTMFFWVSFIVKHAGKSLSNEIFSLTKLNLFRYQMVRVAALAVAAIAWADRKSAALKAEMDE